jgi:hypothetical protein
VIVWVDERWYATPVALRNLAVVSDIVFYGLVAGAVIFATARGVQRRHYGPLLRFYALVVVGVGGRALPL